ncbi:cytochrome c biogenesis CcdA family protein [Tengunoibacter tsumagoiensis]|uniref:Cytochrome C biogenesis protein CcdA n=1 Tax=Tengunoibacter tsumagoiensis TaxID=2014871 RepID=A0A401ZZ65_9CHLR|nr:cytochrome c biogenesis protein CcdA [Tengunoibacter tsumagoiensis]GCE12131.1 cytochrome C biogenesis protein CcdA [Tengunoibacter tsumagoiensis]
MNPTDISLGLAFLAGLASFLSPCVLPLVPIYLIQLVGQSVYQSGQQQTLTARLITFLHALTFVSGFTLTFVALGATASTLGGLLSSHLHLLRQIGGIVLLLAGLYLTGILKLSFLEQQKRFSFRSTRPGYLASLLTGIIFAIAWTPCIGPILSSILILAGSSTTLQQGVLLLLAYALGLGVPFLLLGLGLTGLSLALKRLKPFLGAIQIGTGVLMMIVGVVIFFNLFSYFNAYFGLGLAL